jgi:hypothetical protein
MARHRAAGTPAVAVEFESRAARTSGMILWWVAGNGSPAGPRAPIRIWQQGAECVYARVP